MPKVHPGRLKLFETIEALRAQATTIKEKQELLEAAEDLVWQCSLDDPWFFLSSVVTTLDEHDSANPYKNFPNHDYLEALVRLLEEHQFIGIPKSRQLMASWLVASFGLWWAMTHHGQLILFQSKKEEDANRLIDRVWGVYERLPEHFRRRFPAEHSYLRITFKESDTKIEGIPQGAHQVRSTTPSMFFSDEMAFQDEAEASYTAALPALQGARGGGRGIFVSSAAPGFFQELVCEDVEPGTMQTIIPSWHPKGGLVGWKTKSGLYIAQVHYSADPDKTSAWAEKASTLYPGGITGKQWRAENEIDWFAKSGGRIFEDFAEGIHICPPIEIPAHWRVYRGIDYGLRNPTSCIWIAVDEDGSVWVYDEYYASGKSVPEHAQVIKGRTGRRKVEFTVIDPSTHARTLASTLSVAEQFAQEGVYVSPGDNRVLDGITMMQELFRVQENGEPIIKIFNTCPTLIEELRGYRWMTHSQGGFDRDPREAPVKKNDHGVDALRYVLMSAPSTIIARVGNTRTPAEKNLSVHERIERKLIRERITRGMKEDF